MTFTSAPPQMQPWVRATDDHLTQIDQSLYDLNNALSLMPQRDRAVYTSGPAASYGAATAVVIPANSTVQFVNSTGLIEVTVSAALSAAFNGSIAVGFYLDGAPTDITQAVQFRDATNSSTGSGTSMSYTVAIPVRKGLHTAGIFYQPNNAGTATSQILTSSILVKGL